MEGAPVVPDRFEIVANAAAGGMARVYRALDHVTGEEVALKLLRDSRDTDRFLQEATLLSGLHDPAIVKYVDHGRAPDGVPYLAMEWLVGEELSERLVRGRLSVTETLALGARVAQALAAAHRIGIVHRDIKPANIFLAGGEVGRAKVLDFGIARWSSTGLTETGWVLGTPAYMSPEQARGEREVDARSDLFSLGSVLYECLIGAAPFAGANPVAVLSKIVFQEIPRPASLREDIPAGVDQLVVELLAKDPSARPVDGGAVVRAFDSLPGTGVHAVPTGDTILTPRLGSSEQRFVSVLLTRPEAAAADAIKPLDRIRTAVQSFGGVARQLLDGPIIVTTSGGSPTAVDQVRQAARCARVVHRLLPGAPIVLAMGRADMTGDLAVGDVIDRVAALLSTTSPGSAVRLDEATASLLEGRFDIARGEVIELGAEYVSLDTGRTLLGKPTPFVGRERELAVLEGWFDECVAERRAHAALVTAAAGIGKSRLAQEFSRRVRDRDASVEIWTARGDPTRSGAPFGLLSPLVSGAVGLRDGWPAAERQRRLAEVVGERMSGDERDHTRTFLAELVGAPMPATSHPLLAAARRDPKVLVDHMRRAFCALIASSSRVAPILIVLEDLHWADPPTVQFVDVALRELARQPVFVLAVARPDLDDHFPRLWASRGALRLGLGGLPRRACALLVEDCLGRGEAVDPVVVQRIVEQASGNVFFLEELIRAVASGASTMPDTVLAIATQRLERLPGDARRVMRAASVFGDVFWAGGVAALVGQAEAGGAARWLEELVAREMVAPRLEARFAGEVEYAFRHNLVREAAYATLTETDRQVGHRLAADWLTRAGEGQALVVAQHLERGGDRAGARSWYVRAAAQALEGNDFQAVLRYGARAIDLGAAGGDLREAHELRGAAFMGMAQFAEAPGALRAALALVPEQDREHRIEVHLKLARACFFAFALDEMRGQALAARALLEGLDRPELEAEASAVLCMYDEASGRLVEASEGYTRVLEQARGLYFPSEALLLMTPFWLGEFDVAIDRGRAFVAQARALNDMYALLVALPQLGLALAARGRYGEADRVFLDAREIGTRYAAEALVARSVAMSAGHHLDLFDLAGGEAIASEALEMARSLHYTPTYVSSSIDLLCAAARAGDPGRAEREISAVADAVATTEGQGWHGWLFKLRFTAAAGEIALARGDGQAAVAHADDVIARARAVGRVKYVVLGHLARGQGLLALGGREAALVELRTALDGARRFADPAILLRAGLALLEVDGSDELLAELRAVAGAIAADLPAATRAAFVAFGPVERLLR